MESGRLLMFEGWLIPEVISSDDPRPPSCVSSDSSSSAWLAGMQGDWPQRMSLWSSEASPSCISRPDNAKCYMMDHLIMKCYQHLIEMYLKY